MGCGGRLTQRAAGALRFVTVVFCDISGSTELARRFDPQVWHGLLSSYFETVGETVAAAGGRVEKFIGDAVVGVFGADAPGEDDALRAVEAALAAIERMAAHNAQSAGRHGVQLSIRFGVASGRVVTADRDSSFAVGVVMNRAARLQTAAAADRVVVDLRTWLLVRERVHCEPCAAVPAKGFEQPLQAWTVSRGRSAAKTATRFVNQVELISTLRTHIEQAVRRERPTVIALRGEMGSGKSRILAELITQLMENGTDGTGGVPTVLRLDGRPGDAQRGLWRLEQIHRRLGGRLNGVGSPSTRELQWAIRRRLAELSRERPVLVVVDDYPLAPAVVRELLSFPADATGQPTGPIVAVIAGRENESVAEPADAGPPAGDPTPMAHIAETVLTVPALGEAHAREMLASLVGEVELHCAETAVGVGVEGLVSRSGGNPLFVEQLAAMAVEGIDDDLPPSAEAALGARIVRLSHPARRLLACLGTGERGAEALDLAGVLGFDERTVAEAFDELGACGLDENKTAAQVAYAHLVLSERAEMHGAIAVHLLRAAESDPALFEAAAAHAVRGRECRHDLEPGGEQDRDAARLAIKALISAARHAIGRGESPAAAAMCAQARELDRTGPQSAATLEVAVLESYALAASGRVPQALRRIEEVRALVETPVCPDGTAAADLRLTEAVLRGRLDPGVRRAVQACRDPGLRARLHSWEGVQFAQAGDYPRAERHLRAAYHALQRSSAVLGTGDIYANYSLFLAYGDTPVPEALAEVRTLRHEVAETPILNAVLACADAMLTHLAGDHTGALGVLEEARTVFADFQHVPGLANAWEFTSELAELAGDLEAARDAVLRARSLYDGAGSSIKSLLCSARAYVLDPAGRVPDTTALHEHGSWVARTVGAQVTALAGPGSTAGAPLTRAVDEIAAVRGAGATLTALPGCLRIAQRIGADETAARVRALIAQAETRRRPASSVLRGTAEQNPDKHERVP